MRTHAEGTTDISFLLLGAFTLGGRKEGARKDAASGLRDFWLKSGSEKNADVLRLTSNLPLLDFFEDADYKCRFTRQCNDDPRSPRAVGPFQPLM